jgi:mRNA interferase RelE/StbE
LSEYRIFETQEFRKRLAKVSPSDLEFIRNKLHTHTYPQLRQTPYFGPNIKKLQGYKPELWRYRIGRFRIFYLVDESRHIVFMLTLDDRKDAYR